MRKITLRQAINEAISEEMARDFRVIILGEDIASGGAYSAVCEGLPEKVGKERVINMPISESCFCGAALGAALRGYRPIPFSPPLEKHVLPQISDIIEGIKSLLL